MNPASTRTLALAALTAVALAGSAWAKLPPPSDEAKAKAAEAAAKTAHTGKVDNYKLCQSMDKVAARYLAEAKKAGKPAKAASGATACADPGPFVYTPAAPASGAAPAAPAAAPAAKVAAAPAKK